MNLYTFAKRIPRFALRCRPISCEASRATQIRRYLHSQHAPLFLLRKELVSGRISQQSRSESTGAPARSLTDRAEATEQQVDAEGDDVAARKAQEPAYEITFTCRQCLHRSSHRITKQAYHFGTTLITCPGCKNRHLISDNLKIFSDQNVTLEDILREKGQFLKKGRLGEDGDIEFYDEENNEIGQMLAEQRERKGPGK